MTAVVDSEFLHGKEHLNRIIFFEMAIVTKQRFLFEVFTEFA
jgi:hypothetical protein